MTSYATIVSQGSSNSTPKTIMLSKPKNVINQGVPIVMQVPTDSKKSLQKIHLPTSGAMHKSISILKKPANTVSQDSSNVVLQGPKQTVPKTEEAEVSTEEVAKLSSILSSLKAAGYELKSPKAPAKSVKQAASVVLQETVNEVVNTSPTVPTSKVGNDGAAWFQLVDNDGEITILTTESPEGAHCGQSEGEGNVPTEDAIVYTEQIDATAIATTTNSIDHCGYVYILLFAIFARHIH